MNIIASSPDLSLSGANVLLAQLLAGFNCRGHETQWIVTSHTGIVSTEWLEDLGIFFTSLPPTSLSEVRKRQELLLQHIKNAAPCIYFPNYDFDMLWAVEAMPENCRTVFIMHCDDPVYYKAIQQRGQVMDAIVCVSAYLAAEVRQRWPELKDRVHHIPFGVELPVEGQISKPSLRDGPLEVVYCGRLVEEQKRISDLAEIILNCHKMKLPVRFHIAGSGPDEDAFFQKLEVPIREGQALRLGKIPHDQVDNLLRRSHVFILTSAYEGLPVSLLEAMALGCVPVVTAVKSGIPEIIENGVNGYVVQIGATQEITTQLVKFINNEATLQTCSNLAIKSVEHKGFTLKICLDRYMNLCSELLVSPSNNIPLKKPILPPRYNWYNRIRNRLHFLR